MRFGVLGPLEVLDDSGAMVTPEADKQRILLAVLLCNRNVPISVDRLVDLLWTEAPQSARTNIQVYVHRLRRRIGSDRVQHGPAGYQLPVSGDELDSERFERLSIQGEEQLMAGAVAEAGDTLAAALELWRGPAYSGIDDVEPIRVEAARLSEMRLATLENRIRADLALGRHAAVVPELTQLVTENPMRERVRGLLMLALYRSGRTAEALETFRAGRQLAVDELGLEPGAELREIERAILANDFSIYSPAGQEGQPQPFSTPSELPAADSAFTGRYMELEQVRRRLRAPCGDAPAPVVAISGAGGVGKSAFARRVAHDVAGVYPDGQMYVNLHGATPGTAPIQPRDVLGWLLRSLGLDDIKIPATADEAAAMFRSMTAERRVLIMLDNAADSAQVRPLLPGQGSGSAVIITSRSVLSALDVAHHIQLSSLTGDEAVDLLARLAGAERVAAEPSAAAEMADMCDRLPLALRIAGARLTARPDWTLASMCDRLRDRGARLDELEHDDLAVRSSCSVSYLALPAGAARTFAAIGMLDVNHVTAPTVAALVDRPLADARSDLDRLVDARLLDASHDGRLLLHDLLRLYARERAAETFTESDRHDAVTRVLHHFLATARAAMHVLAPGRSDRANVGIPEGELGARPLDVTDGDAAGAWVRAESPNVVALVHHAAMLPGTGSALTVALGAVLSALLHTQSLWAEQANVARVTLEVAQGTANPLWIARAHNDMGMISTILGRYGDADDHLRRAFALFDEIGDADGRGLALDSLGSLNTLAGHPDRSVSYHRRAYEIFSAASDGPRAARTLNNLALALQHAGDHSAAMDTYHAALRAQERLGDLVSGAVAMLNLGQLHLDMRDPAAALKVFGQAADVFSQVGYSRRHALALWKAGVAHHHLGQLDEARADWWRALELVREAGNLSPEDVAEIMSKPVPDRPMMLRET